MLLETIVECERRIAAARQEKLRAIAEFCRSHEQDEFAAAELALAASVDRVLRQHVLHTSA
ncbi:hypothetical protein LX83_002910 [Goodfellowiella coeruleoviolacea]|uniref:Uncharacterized protein n=1 Tax=Goodfellowiella coeruleoviolacea TaxID=334858 RepID=A0AAE3GD62_9PSEU|nr:hypothetical protein [Goodfellowiella coeruleoviolacea]